MLTVEPSLGLIYTHWSYAGSRVRPVAVAADCGVQGNVGDYKLIIVN